jgi:hypothetical protein
VTRPFFAGAEGIAAGTATIFKEEKA